VPRRSAAEADLIAPETLARFRADWARVTGDEEGSVLVAFSGGPDSTALLLLARAALGSRCLAATVDHGLRPESAAEARLAAAFCERRDIPHAVLAGSLPLRANRGANLSARARALRYELLHAHAAAVGARWIATAHHADDQLETVVMRLNRASGVAGLAGIRAVNGAVVRPLLEWRRADLSAIVAHHGLTAVTDPTNTDDRYDRARLRKALEGADWLDAAHAARSAGRLAEAEDALDWAAQRLSASWEEAGGIALDVTGVPVELRRRMVRSVIGRLDPDADPREDRLIGFLDRLARGERATVAGVIGQPTPSIPDRQVWRFTPAPPRRTVDGGT
jgi:tRNA(Ile)-lysidine synthase